MIPRLLATMTHDLPEEQQLVVYNDSGQKLIVLNEIGAAVYFLVDGQRTVDGIAEFMAETMPDVPLETCRTDVETFLKTLESHGVVAWTSEAVSTT